MSVLSINAAPSVPVRGTEVSARSETENSEPEVSEEVAALQEALEEEFFSDEDNAPAPTRTVLDFVNEQLGSGENPDDVVAFLLSVADEEINGANRFDGSLESLFNVEQTDEREQPPTLSEVLDLAADTFRQLRDSDASIGLSLSVLTEQLEGLQEIRA